MGSLPGWALFVLVCAVILGSSPDLAVCTANQPPQNATTKNENAKEDCSPLDIIVFRSTDRFIRDNTNEVSAALTALATIAIAYFTFTLWSTSAEQAALTRDSIRLASAEFNAVYRPKIRIGYIKIGPLEAGARPTAEIWAINMGDGPARVIELGVDIFPRRMNVAGTSYIRAAPVPYPGIPPVEPGQQVNIKIQGQTVLTQPIIDGILGVASGAAGAATPTMQLCTVGTVHYLDANSTRRLTSFFRIYNPQRLRFMRAPEDDEYAEWDYEA